MHHVPDIKSLDGLRDMVLLGILVMFSEALDRRSYIGPGFDLRYHNEAKKTRVNFKAFCTWFDEHYEISVSKRRSSTSKAVQWTETLSNQIVKENAMGFTVMLARYYLRVAQDRENAGAVDGEIQDRDSAIFKKQVRKAGTTVLRLFDHDSTEFNEATIDDILEDPEDAGFDDLELRGPLFSDDATIVITTRVGK